MSKATHDCSARTWPEGSFHSYPCRKRASIERDGKWYCGIHDPVAKAEKQAARDAKWQTKWEARKARQAAEEQQANVAAKWAAVGPRLLEALRVAEDRLRYVSGIFNDPNFIDRYGDGERFLKAADEARAAIKEATGE